MFLLWKHLIIFDLVGNLKKPIDIVLLSEAEEYFYSLSEKSQTKLLKSFDKTKEGIKGQWFKSLRNEIWEFRD